MLLRSIVFNVIFVSITIIICLIALPSLVTQRTSLGVARFWAKCSLKLLQWICKITITHQGMQNIPDGPCLIASKHQSALETLFFAAEIKNFTYILKQELMYVPIFGWYLKRSGMIPVNRSNAGRSIHSLLQNVLEAAKLNKKIIIFPEGTRTLPGEQKPYKNGIAIMYAKLGVPCIPVSLDTGKAWRKNSFLKTPGDVHIQIHSQIEKGLTQKELLNTLRSCLEDLNLQTKPLIDNPTV